MPHCSAFTAPVHTLLGVKLGVKKPQDLTNHIAASPHLGALLLAKTPRMRLLFIYWIYTDQ